MRGPSRQQLRTDRTRPASWLICRLGARAAVGRRPGRSAVTRLYRRPARHMVHDFRMSLRVLLLGASDVEGYANAFRRVIDSMKAVPECYIGGSSHTNFDGADYANSSVRLVQDADICTVLVVARYGELLWSKEVPAVLESRKPFVLLVADGLYKTYRAYAMTGGRSPDLEQQRIFDALAALEPRGIQARSFQPTDFDEVFRAELIQILRHGLHSHGENVALRREIENLQTKTRQLNGDNDAFRAAFEEQTLRAQASNVALEEASAKYREELNEVHARSIQLESRLSKTGWRAWGTGRVLGLLTCLVLLGAGFGAWATSALRSPAPQPAAPTAAPATARGLLIPPPSAGAFSPMQCVPDAYYSLLAHTPAQEEPLTRLGYRLQQMESRRKGLDSTYPKEGSHPRVLMSKFAPGCLPLYRKAYQPDPAASQLRYPEDYAFLWTGPYETLGAAKESCDLLHLMTVDCFVVQNR